MRDEVVTPRPSSEQPFAAVPTTRKPIEIPIAQPIELRMPIGVFLALDVSIPSHC